jgi:molybdopterin synthase sulfur carrier subunit
MADVTVKIPTPLRKYTGGADSVSVQGADVRAVIDGLEAKHAGIRANLCDDNGKLRRFINIYANEEDIRFLDDLDTQLQDGDELLLVPAIAGGA